MHMLVTGGAGFIGSNSVDLLLSQGHRVRVLDNLYSGSRNNLPQHKDLEFIEADIRDGAAVEHALRGVTHVLHLAAQVFVPTSIEAPTFSASVNVAGFLTVLEAARQANVQRFVYASSAAVYGAPTELPLTETSAPAALSPYALEKLINDQYASLFQQMYGMSCCGLRYFNVYGPRQDPRSPYSGVISKFCDRIRAGAPLTIFGDGLQTRDFVSVADVAIANMAALLGDATGVVNVASGHSVTLLQLVQALGTAVGRRIEVTHEAARDGEVRLSSVNPVRLQQELGLHRPVALEHGLRQLLHSLGA